MEWFIFRLKTNGLLPCMRSDIYKNDETRKQRTVNCCCDWFDRQKNFFFAILEIKNKMKMNFMWPPCSHKIHCLRRTDFCLSGLSRHADVTEDYLDRDAFLSWLSQKKRRFQMLNLIYLICIFNVASRGAASNFRPQILPSFGGHYY